MSVRQLQRIVESGCPEQVLTENALTTLFGKRYDAAKVQDDLDVDQSEAALGLLYGLTYKLMQDLVEKKGKVYAYLRSSVDDNYDQYLDLMNNSGLRPGEDRWSEVRAGMKKAGRSFGKLAVLNMLIPGYSIFKIAGKILNKGVKAFANRGSGRDFEESVLQSLRNQLREELIAEKKPVTADYEDDFDIEDNLEGEEEADVPQMPNLNPRNFAPPYTAVMYYQEMPATVAEALQVCQKQIQYVYKTYAVPVKKVPGIFSYLNHEDLFTEGAFESAKYASLQKMLNKTSSPAFNSGKIDAISVFLSNYLKKNLQKEYYEFMAYWKKNVAIDSPWQQEDEEK